MIYGIILYIITIVLMLSMVAFLINKIDVSRRDSRRQEYTDNKNVKIDELALQLLDALIVESHTEYMTTNFIDHGYISREQEIDTVREVSEIVHRRISPILLDKLSVVYSKASLGEIIATKVYFYNMDYVIKNNVGIQTKNKG